MLHFMCYSPQLESDEELLHIYYSALNFKDVMTATGRLPLKPGGQTNVVSTDTLHDGYSHRHHWDCN
jgi:hypothetical protein